MLTDAAIIDLEYQMFSHFLLLYNKLSQNSVVQSKHFIVLIDGVDQELRLGTVRVTCHCSMISDASAGKTQKLGVFEWLGTGIIWRQLYLHMSGGECCLLTRTPAGPVSHNTYLAPRVAWDFFTAPWLNSKSKLLVA